MQRQVLLVLTNSHKCICSKASKLLIKRYSLARGFEELPVPVLIVGKEKEEAVMNREKRNSISVILKDVEKFMAKHLTYEHIFAGILEKDLLCATGCFVAKDSQGVMSFRDIEEPIQVKRDLNAQNVLKDSCGVIISPNMSKRTRIRKVVGQLLPLLPRENWTRLLQRCLAPQELSQLQPFLKIQIQQLPTFQPTWKNSEKLFITETSSAALKFTHLRKSGNGLVKWITEQEITFSFLASLSIPKFWVNM